MATYDLLLKNGLVVDPVNGIREVRHILIGAGRICSNTADLGGMEADCSLDLAGKMVVPGIIDTHVHLGGYLDAGYAMLAAAGVTTAIDFSGSVSEAAEKIKLKGSGISIGILEALVPGDTLSGVDCSRREINAAVAKTQDNGALGVKIIGGHYPLTAETTAAIIDEANLQRTYVAFHAGTLQTPQPFLAFKEAVGMARGRQLHLAHINSYCRGRSQDYLSEMQEALALLEENRNIISESYLSNFNGTSGECRDDLPISQVTRNELARAGCDISRAGLAKAIRQGIAHVCMEDEGIIRLITGEEALRLWQSRNTAVHISFAVNPGINAVAFALRRGADGSFTINAISTDGGGIPRNSIIELGLPLTRYQDFSIEDFVIKTSVMPARMFNLQHKGHLQEGADADVTVLDMETFRPFMAVARGQIIMLEGRVCGRGGSIITTERGRPHLEGLGMDYQVADIANGFLYNKSIGQEIGQGVIRSGAVI